MSGERGQRLTGLRILVVDDIPALRYILLRWLVAEGATVIGAGSAGEAIQRAKELSPQLALVDLAMPGQDGFYLLNQLRLLEKDFGYTVPVVAISSLPAAEVQRAALGAGFDAFMERPADPEPLVDVLRLLAAAQSKTVPRAAVEPEHRLGTG
jgi:CheY-like chemotaxis protein